MLKQLAVVALVNNVSAVQIDNWTDSKQFYEAVEKEDTVQAQSWSRIRGAMAAWKKAYNNRSTTNDTSNNGGSGGSDSNSNSNLPWITQTPVAKTCNGSLQRLQREAKGNINVVAGKKFEDQSFPAQSDSITWSGTITRTWKRPSEAETSPSLWGSKGIRPAAINQGGLGDCWFLASIAALGEWPDRVKKLFNGQE